MFRKFNLKAVCFSVLLFSSSCFAESAPSLYSTVFSILSYAQWNNAAPAICVLDNASLAHKFKAHSPNPANFKISSIHSADIKSYECQVLIFSSFSPQAEQRFLNTSVRFPALSISTNNTECELGSAFCIYKRNSNYAFKVNLSSLSQAKVHVDPRVLLLGKNIEANK